MLTLIWGYSAFLVIVGVVTFSLSSAGTALIPAYIGLVLAGCALASHKASLRKHAMHVAALLALLGTAGTFTGLLKLPLLLSGAPLERPLAVLAQSLTCLASVIFLFFCIRSFIRARVLRSNEAA